MLDGVRELWTRRFAFSCVYKFCCDSFAGWPFVGCLPSVGFLPSVGWPSLGSFSTLPFWVSFHPPFRLACGINEAVLASASFGQVQYDSWS